jgi:SAM-dependent methyltransferase
LDERGIEALFGSYLLDGAAVPELNTYWQQDWRRFIYTVGLVSHLKGNCLEIGANPYFTTTLLHLYTPLKLTQANYFGPHFGATATQTVSVNNPSTGERESFAFTFMHFNIEDASFPFSTSQFDVVLVCEVIEHLQSDPVKVFREIKRILKPGGHLILTTPNVSRLENVARMLAGENIYDPYSAYGPYGRHNREYTKHELAQLLNYCGFEVEVLFSADVHENLAANFFSLDAVVPLVKRREADLGQYLFLRSRNNAPSRTKRPGWLYRSFPPGDLEP